MDFSHTRVVARLGTCCQAHSLPTWKTTPRITGAIVSVMATRIRKGARVHYYIKEWITHLGLSDQDVANRMGLASRTSVWKLYTEQHRLSPEKIAQIADALDRHPSELLYPPEVPSLDAMAEQATPEQRAAIAADIMRRMRKTG